jgi:hypothetical protein
MVRGPLPIQGRYSGPAQSIGRRHDRLDLALGSLMGDDLAFLRS